MASCTQPRSQAITRTRYPASISTPRMSSPSQIMSAAEPCWPWTLAMGGDQPFELRHGRAVQGEQNVELNACQGLALAVFELP